MLLPSPKELIDTLPRPSAISKSIERFRENIGAILSGNNKKIIVVVGPCSLHNPQSAIIYGEKLKKLSEAVSDSCQLIMRTYLEKPRTKMGWKGYLYDPFLDGSHNLARGLYLSREILLELAKLELPLATEFLDPLTAPYFSDLISWGCIGARTASSSIHRQMASALPMPVGFKNSTEGSITDAIHGIAAAQQPHTFITLGQNGKHIAAHSEGNAYTHLVLRGGKAGPNYTKDHVSQSLDELDSMGITTKILIDCSHGNSGKDHTKQPAICANVMSQIAEGNHRIAGVMLESFLEGGSQWLCEDPSSIKSTLSVTDPCISWEETEELLMSIDALLGSDKVMRLTHS